MPSPDLHWMDAILLPIHGAIAYGAAVLIPNDLPSQLVLGGLLILQFLGFRYLRNEILLPALQRRSER